VAELLAERGKPDDADAPWFGTVEPLAPGWAGVVLLARAAPYAKHRDYYSALFDSDTMEPHVASPAVVRALKELVAAARLAPPDVRDLDAAGARRVFWEGRCGMALSWPTATAKIEADSAAGKGGPIAVGFAELPGSKKVYHVGNQAWEARSHDAERRVPLLGIAGRLGVVASEAQDPQAAFQLLLWLSGKQRGTQVCSGSPDTTIYRQSQVKDPKQCSRWVEEPVGPAAATEYAQVTQTTLRRRQQWLFVPRIPGRSEYMAALDRAVRAAVAGEKTPAEALQEAASRWKEITDRLRVESQKRAYLDSLGL
jgi:multiple sugar transport system substrate-binding protein